MTMGVEQVKVKAPDDLVLAGAEAIERAKSKSKQPRFSDDQANAWYANVYRFLKDYEITREPYKPDSRVRDGWLREWAMKEPYWQAVLRSCRMLDANRGWSYVGGRNQVNRYVGILHDANDGAGWRRYCMLESGAFREADICAVTEVGRDGKRGPVRAIYSVDPVRCALSGKPITPLYYYPAGGGSGDVPQKWGPGDFFRVVSNESTDETMRGLGWCATSAAFELLVLLNGVLNHDQEALGARMPKGLLLLQGIGEDQWEQALRARNADLDAAGRARYGGVMVLATSGDLPPDAKLVALSKLPAGFDRKVFMEQTWYGYAAIVGRDASEFFPVQTGSIGRGLEPEVQHRAATVKGGAEFVLGWQEQWQNLLPPTLHFEFDERDVEGALAEAQVAQAWTDVAASIRYPTGSALDGESITGAQYLTYLVEKGVLPPEWTEMEEEAEGTDIEEARRRYLHRLLDKPGVARAVECYQHEPIVRYHWRGIHGATERVLWQSGADALSKLRRWRGWRSGVRRQDESDETLYEGDDFAITDTDIERALAFGARAVPPGDDEKDEPGLAELYGAQLYEEQRKRSLMDRLRGIRP